MKTFLLLCAILQLLHSPCDSEEVRFISPKLDINKLLKGKNECQVDGARIQFTETGNGLTITNSSGKLLKEIREPLFIAGITHSDKNKSTALLIQRLDGRGADYSQIIVITAQGNELIFKDAMTQDSLRKGTWVIEIGGISNNGTRLLVKVGAGGESYKWQGKLFSPHEWQTWDIVAGQMVSRGIKVPEN